MAPRGKQVYTVGTLRYTAAGLAVVVFWLLFGGFAIAYRDRSAVPSITEFLRQHHASDTMIAMLVSALPALLSSVLVPLVSFRSDRFRSRRGRRLPFLMATTPIAALTMIGLGNCSFFGRMTDRLLGAASPGSDACQVAWFCVFWTLFEGIALVTLSLYAGLVNDIVPRQVLGRFFAGFRIVSLGAGIMFNMWVFRLTEHNLQEIFIGAGLYFGAACMLMCVRLKEGEYGPVDDAGAAAAVAGNRFTLSTYCRECFSDRYFVLVFLALVASEITFVPFNTFSQVYAASLGMDKATLGELLATSYTVSICLSPVIGWLVDRYSASVVTLAAMGLYLSVTLAGFILVCDVRSFAPMYVLHAIVSGIYYTASASLPMALFPRARFLQFDSAKRFFCAASTILLSFLLGPTLDSTGHFYGLTLLYGTFLAAISLVTFWALNRSWSGRLHAALSA